MPEGDDLARRALKKAIRGVRATAMPDANRVTHVRIARGSGNPTRLTVASGDQKGFFCSLAAATRLHSVRTTALEVAGFPAPQADLREDAGLQDGPVHEHAQALLEALSHGGVRGQQLSHIVHRLLVVDRERRELDDRRRVRADSADAEDGLLAVVGHDDLHETVGGAHAHGAGHKVVPVARGHVGDVLLLAVGLAEADSSDLLVQEHDLRQVVRVRRHLPARTVDVLDRGDGLVLALVDEGDVDGGVADGVDVLVRLATAEVVYDELAVLDAAAGLLDAEPAVLRHTADGDERALHFVRLEVARLGVLHGVIDVRVGRALPHRLEVVQGGVVVEAHAALGEQGLDVRSDVLVLHGQHAVALLDDAHLRLAEVRGDGGELAADHTGANDHHALGERRAHEVVAGLDGRAVGGVRRVHARDGARGDDEVVGVDGLGRGLRGALGRVHVDEVRRLKLAHATDDLDARLVERRGDLPLARHGGLDHPFAEQRLVHLEVLQAAVLVHAAAEGADAVVELGHLPHRLRLQRAVEQVGAADLAALDEAHLAAVLLRAQRRRHAGGAAADDAHVELLRGESEEGEVAAQHASADAAAQ
eukprot:CAMPEP_0174854654 /NCGR_PEP_ID=MMETSP1114-20130205/31880_1 /TAXON_ID=312471 /ORGANISM="Neobodo designis, Strain CCAP 1951/1" /LENGTH=590 /DNA_ID=CAMNT_0016089365 /DNA_START=150 /DNA_END=1924 /DNA_ORIENTATION=+